MNEQLEEPLLKRPLNKDISIYKDTSIKVSSNKDSKHPVIEQYNYEQLQEILSAELGGPITLKQAEQIGKDLLDVYEALYFEDAQEYNK